MPNERDVRSALRRHGATTTLSSRQIDGIVNDLTEDADECTDESSTLPEIAGEMYDKYFLRKGDNSDKKYVVFRLKGDAPDFLTKAVVEAHLGFPVPNATDIEFPPYLMGPRDHFFELIKVTLEAIRDEEIVDVDELVEYVYEESKVLIRAVRMTEKDEVRVIVTNIVDALWEWDDRGRS